MEACMKDWKKDCRDECSRTHPCPVGKACTNKSNCNKVCDNNYTTCLFNDARKQMEELMRKKYG